MELDLPASCCRPKPPPISANASALILAHKHEDALARAAQFWPLAAEAIAKALSGAVSREAAKKALGDAMAVEDAAEMALMLTAGDAVENLARVLPKPGAVLHRAPGVAGARNL